MKVAISNIAWNPNEDESIRDLLKKYSFTGVEIAPTKIWKEPADASIESVKAYRKLWNDKGIDIVSIQALLFAHPEMRIFKDSGSRQMLLKYIDKMLKVCSILGVQDIIFGSPVNRKNENLTAKQAFEIAIEFFYEIGQIAQKYNIFFCIEPVPIENGTNFINNTDEGYFLVKAVNQPHFRLHLDSGALTINNEDYKSAISKAFPYLNHFHISERNLLPIGTADTDHTKIAQILKTKNFNHWLSIEMRGSNSQSNTSVVEKTLQYVSSIYF